MPRDPRPIDNAIDIITPENIAFEYRVAGPFRRLPAFALDVAIRGAVIAAAMVVGLWKREELTRLWAVNTLFSEQNKRHTESPGGLDSSVLCNFTRPSNFTPR